MDILSNLKYAAGSKKKRKRVARGEGSGHGGTATRGMNGQLSRSGAKKKIWFEGGQMPLQRRVPKFGFTNIFKKEYQIVNLNSLQKLSEKNKSLLRNKNLGFVYQFHHITAVRPPSPVRSIHLMHSFYAYTAGTKT